MKTIITFKTKINGSICRINYYLNTKLKKHVLYVEISHKRTFLNCRSSLEKFNKINAEIESKVITDFIEKNSIKLLSEKRTAINCQCCGQHIETLGAVKSIMK